MPIPKKTKTKKTTKVVKISKPKEKKVSSVKKIAKSPKKSLKKAAPKTKKKTVSKDIEKIKIIQDDDAIDKITPLSPAPEDIEEKEELPEDKDDQEEVIQEKELQEDKDEDEDEDKDDEKDQEPKQIEYDIEPTEKSPDIEDDIDKKEDEQESSQKEEFAAEPDKDTDDELDKTNLDEVYDFEYSGENKDDYSNGKKKVPLTIYRKIAFSFILLTLVLLMVVFYFTFIKVTIKIKTSEEIFNQNLIVDVYDTSKYESKTKDKDIVGVVKKFNVELSKKYTSTGQEVVDKEVVGKVNLINRYSKDQPLIASTRLLSSDGKLFRIKETVTVPAKGTVQATVYADRPGEEMAIGATIFTIPGLWSGLQDKIYAESKEAFRYAERFKKFILEDDIDDALADLRKEIIIKSKKEVSEVYSDYDNFIYSINEDSIEQDIDGDVDQEVEEFSVDMETEVIVVAFNNKKIKDMAYQKLISDLPYDKKLIKLNSKSFNYNLNNYDLTEGIASLNVVFSGELSFDENIGTIIEKEKLLGLTRKQLEEYLKGRNDISSFEIKFWPSFISKVPNLIDRIEIVITNDE